MEIIKIHVYSLLKMVLLSQDQLLFQNFPFPTTQRKGMHAFHSAKSSHSALLQDVKASEVAKRTVQNNDSNDASCIQGPRTQPTGLGNGSFCQLFFPC